MIETNNSAAKFKNTGWAVFCAFPLSSLYYVIYRLLFDFIISVYSSYDPAFRYGLGAVILSGLGANVLGFMSATVTVRHIFKMANPFGVFYVFAVMIVVIIATTYFSDLANRGFSILVLIGDALILSISIAIVRFVAFLPPRSG